MKKYVISIISIIAAFALALTILFNSEELLKAVTGNNIDNRKTIIVDAGHGGLTNTIKV